MFCFEVVLLLYLGFQRFEHAINRQYIEKTNGMVSVKDCIMAQSPSTIGITRIDQVHSMNNYMADLQRVSENQL